MTFNVWTFLFEVLNFLVLAFVLHWLLYRPLRAAVERRQQGAAREREEAASARQEAAALEQRLQAQLAEQERERQQLLRQAHEQAEADRKKLLAETERVIRDRQEEQRRALAREREEALQALQGEVAGIAVDLTRRLLAGAADSTLHRQLTLRLAEALGQVPAEEREHLRAQWQPGDGAVLETAQELDGPALGQVTDAVGIVLGRPVTPAVQVRPELLGGVRLRLGGQVWDASLAGQLVAGPAAAVQEEPCPNGQGA
jgi:F-type H+-transporting ATPase subunit b